MNAYETGRWVLDQSALFRQMDDARRRRGITWAQVSRETDLAAPTFHRLIAGRNLSVNTLATFMAWLGNPLPLTRRAGSTSDGAP